MHSIRQIFTAIVVTALITTPVHAGIGHTTEFCIDGEYDLGARYQGLNPGAGEWYPMTWCVITEGNDGRVQFSGSGKSNPDMDGDWTVAYLPPDLVRIVNRESPPDIEFSGATISDEIKRIRRLDPTRLANEVSTSGNIDGMDVVIKNDRVVRVATQAELPLRGEVDVTWLWDWSDERAPKVKLKVDGVALLRGTGRWRLISEAGAAATWEGTSGEAPVDVDGSRWPSEINMRRVDVADGVYLVRGVRTGFQHMVIDTSEGLVVGDAPAGWIEFHHLPPADLQPGLGTDGLSKLFIEVLDQESPDRPLHAVALTHLHDDHAGGARAFHDAGANVYVATELQEFFDDALGIETIGVNEKSIIGVGENRAAVVSLGAGPHANSMMGLWAMDAGWFFVSDIHVPRDDSPAPRKGREATECWFAKWAVASLPEDTIVVNSHSPIETPVSRLRDYLESPGCQ